MPVRRHMACPRMLKMVSLSSSLVVAGSSTSISSFSPGRRGNPSPWLRRKKIKTDGIFSQYAVHRADGSRNTRQYNTTPNYSIKSYHGVNQYLSEKKKKNNRKTTEDYQLPNHNQYLSNKKKNKKQEKIISFIMN